MKKIELLTVLRSLEKLHEMGKPEAALELIKEILANAKATKRKS